MKIVSKLSERCQKCHKIDACDEKRMMACAIAEMPEPVIAPATAEISAPIMESVLVKHDYRDVKIDPHTTVTIDLEDIKKQLTQDFYRAVGCPGLSL